MEVRELRELFEEFSRTDHLKFERVQTPKSSRPDLHAFLLLDSLVPGTSDLISAAEHDEIYLDIRPDQLAPVANEDHVLELVRCGVRYGEYGLCMFA